MTEYLSTTHKAMSYSSVLLCWWFCIVLKAIPLTLRFSFITDIDTEELTKDNTALILGTTFGTLAFVVVVTAVAYYVYNRNKWRRFLADHWEDERVVDSRLSYPVTESYFKGRRGHPRYSSLRDGAAQTQHSTETEKTLPPVIVTPSPS